MSGYRLYPTMEVQTDGNSKALLYSIPKTNEYCHFITTPNMTAGDALKYLFSYAVGENGLNPPAYLIHNMLDNKGYITTLEKLFSSEMTQNQSSVAKIPFSITESIIANNMYVMSNPDMFASTGGIDSSKLMFNYKFMEYDQEERRWDDYGVNKLVLNDLVTRGINSSSEASLFLKNVKENIELAKYYEFVPHSHPCLYDVMKNLELYSSNLQFSIDGDLRFDVGQVIAVNEPGVYDSKIEQFHGRWLVCKVRHSFRNKQYRVNMICCRRFYHSKTL